MNENLLLNLKRKRRIVIYRERVRLLTPPRCHFRGLTCSLAELNLVMLIYLLGFMGSGKSTLERLGNALEMTFYDSTV
ncbi:MAG: hypothetical protein R2727_06640 [Bacteroidales bacterium]